MYSTEPPLLGNGPGRSPNLTLVACALALREGSFRNESEAKDQYGIDKTAHVRVHRFNPRPLTTDRYSLLLCRCGCEPALHR